MLVARGSLKAENCPAFPCCLAVALLNPIPSLGIPTFIIQRQFGIAPLRLRGRHSERNAVLSKKPATPLRVLYLSIPNSRYSGNFFGASFNFLLLALRRAVTIVLFSFSGPNGLIR